MNILIVNQSVIDMGVSFFILMLAVVEVDGTRMSSDSVYDQLVCHIWLTRQPLFYFVIMSFYGTLLMALDRYIAVIHPIWQNNNVRTPDNLKVFPALHATQTRSSDENFVHPSVSLSVSPSVKRVHCDTTEERSVQIFYTIRKII